MVENSRHITHKKKVDEGKGGTERQRDYFLSSATLDSWLEIIVYQLHIIRKKKPYSHLFNRSQLV